MKIKNLPKCERPRERLAHYGPDKLSKSELLAILLGTGTKGVNAVELASRIVKKFGDKLAEADFKTLKSTFGLGPAKAAEIIAALELGKRLLKGKQTTLVLSPKDVWENLKDIRDNKKEHFVVFYLNTRNQAIQREIISVGTLNANLVHPREVFELAVKHLAAQIIVAHNHPSGNPEPSEDDLAITKRLIEAGKLLGIQLLDHVIVAQKDFISLKEMGLI